MLRAARFGPPPCFASAADASCFVTRWVASTAEPTAAVNPPLRVPLLTPLDEAEISFCFGQNLLFRWTQSYNTASFYFSFILNLFESQQGTCRKAQGVSPQLHLLIHCNAVTGFNELAYRWGRRDGNICRCISFGDQSKAEFFWRSYKLHITNSTDVGCRLLSSSSAKYTNLWQEYAPFNRTCAWKHKDFLQFTRSGGVGRDEMWSGCLSTGPHLNVVSSWGRKPYSNTLDQALHSVSWKILENVK